MPLAGRMLRWHSASPVAADRLSVVLSQTQEAKVDQDASDAPGTGVFGTPAPGIEARTRDSERKRQSDIRPSSRRRPRTSLALLGKEGRFFEFVLAVIAI